MSDAPRGWHRITIGTVRLDVPADLWGTPEFIEFFKAWRQHAYELGERDHEDH